MNRFCRACGTPLQAEVRFCPFCGTETGMRASDERNLSTVPPGSLPAKPPSAAEKRTFKIGAGAAGVASGLAGGFVAAPAGAGEMAFGTSFLTAVTDALPDLGPLQMLLSGGASLIGGMGGIFKDKKRLIPVIALALLWFLLLLLPALGINFAPVRILSWLTLAHGGTGGGILSIIGGFIGKGVFAGLVVSLFSGSGAFPSLGRGLKNLFSSFAVKGSGGYSVLLGGAGLALIAYNFMAGSATLANGMAAVAPLLLSLKALGGRAGFLRRFLGSLARGPGKNFTGLAPEIPLAGLAAGFTLSIPLSALPFASSGYILGVLLLLAGGILKYFLKDKKEGEI